MRRSASTRRRSSTTASAAARAATSSASCRRRRTSTSRRRWSTLADRYGIALEYEETSARGDAERRRRERLRALLEQVTDVLRARAPGGARRRRRRAPTSSSAGSAPRSARASGVGFALQGWDKLRDAARSKGFTEQELLDAGLVIPGKRGGVYDRFRGAHRLPARRRPGAHAGLRRPDARRREAQVPELARDAALPQERGRLRPRQGEGRRGSRRPRLRRRGLHRRACSCAGRGRERRRLDGDGPHRGAAQAPCPPHAQPLPLLRRRRRRHGRDAARPRAGAAGSA